MVSQSKTREDVKSWVGGWDEIVCDRDNNCYYFIRHKNFQQKQESVSYCSYQEAIESYWSGNVVWHPKD